jgi:hypothetical protein
MGHLGHPCTGNARNHLGESLEQENKTETRHKPINPVPEGAIGIVGFQRGQKRVNGVMIAQPEEWGHRGDNWDIAHHWGWGPKSAHKRLKWLMGDPCFMNVEVESADV